MEVIKSPKITNKKRTKTWILKDMSIIDEDAEENLSFKSNDSLKTKMGKLGIFDMHYYRHMRNKVSACNECHSHSHLDVI